MSASIIELYNSREGTESLDDDSAAFIYAVTGTHDDQEVRTLVESTAPEFYLGLARIDYDFRPLGNGLWDCAVHYGVRQRITSDVIKSFDTTGATAHITQSKATVGSYLLGGGTAPTCDGAIGFDGNKVNGTDVISRAFNFQITKCFPLAHVTDAYLLRIADLTGTVNQANFYQFAAETLLFRGASGGQRNQEDWEITFQFSYQPNVTGLSVGGITGIAKKGWEYLWFLYGFNESQNRLVSRPVAAYVERVYDRGDFVALGV